MVAQAAADSVPFMSVLLITGGSRGIGAAIAVGAAKRGWQIAVSYRTRAAEAAGVVEQCRAAGVDALAVQADVTVEADVLRLFETVEDHLGTPYGFVNNAGAVPARHSRVDAVATADVRAMFEVNSVAAFVCAREAARRMVAAGRGVIVNMSSRAAVIGGAGEYVHYAAAKAAVDALTVGLSNEVADHGVRVVGIRPGLINTEIHASGGDPDRTTRIAPAIPMRRVGEPEEVAAATLWLLSDEASYVTGTTIDVGGGR